MDVRGIFIMFLYYINQFFFTRIVDEFIRKLFTNLLVLRSTLNENILQYLR